MITHKFSYYHNSYAFTVCGKGLIPTNRGQVKPYSKLWSDVDCKKCLNKKQSIRNRIKTALKNIEK